MDKYHMKKVGKHRNYKENKSDHREQQNMDGFRMCLDILQGELASSSLGTTALLHSNFVMHSCVCSSSKTLPGR